MLHVDIQGANLEVFLRTRGSDKDYTNLVYGTHVKKWVRVGVGVMGQSCL